MQQTKHPINAKHHRHSKDNANPFPTLHMLHYHTSDEIITDSDHNQAVINSQLTRQPNLFVKDIQSHFTNTNKSRT